MLGLCERKRARERRAKNNLSYKIEFKYLRQTVTLCPVLLISWMWSPIPLCNCQFAGDQEFFAFLHVLPKLSA